MRWRVKPDFGLETAPAGAVEGVSVRVLRAGLSWAYAAGGGTWQMLIPVAVVDERSGSRRIRPVIDYDLLLRLGGILAVAAWLKRRRKSP